MPDFRAREPRRARRAAPAAIFAQLNAHATLEVHPSGNISTGFGGYSVGLEYLYRKAGFDDVRIEPFAEREGATDPSNPFWRFPWAAIIARKPA